MDITIDDLLNEDFRERTKARNKRLEVTWALFTKKRTAEEQKLWDANSCIGMIDSLITFCGYETNNPYLQRQRTAERMINDDYSKRYLADHIKKLGVETVKHYAEIRIQKARKLYCN